MKKQFFAIVLLTTFVARSGDAGTPGSANVPESGFHPVRAWNNWWSGKDIAAAKLAQEAQEKAAKLAQETQEKAAELAYNAQLHIQAKHFVEANPVGLGLGAFAGGIAGHVLANSIDFADTRTFLKPAAKYTLPVAGAVGGALLGKTFLNNGYAQIGLGATIATYYVGRTVVDAFNAMDRKTKIFTGVAAGIGAGLLVNNFAPEAIPSLLSTFGVNKAVSVIGDGLSYVADKASLHSNVTAATLGTLVAVPTGMALHKSYKDRTVAQEITSVEVANPVQVESVTSQAVGAPEAAPTVEKTTYSTKKKVGIGASVLVGTAAVGAGIACYTGHIDATAVQTAVAEFFKNTVPAGLTTVKNLIVDHTTRKVVGGVLGTATAAGAGAVVLYKNRSAVTTKAAENAVAELDNVVKPALSQAQRNFATKMAAALDVIFNLPMVLATDESVYVMTAQNEITTLRNQLLNADPSIRMYVEKNGKVYCFDSLNPQHATHTNPLVVASLALLATNRDLLNGLKETHAALYKAVVAVMVDRMIFWNCSEDQMALRDFAATQLNESIITLNALTLSYGDEIA